MKPSNGCIAVPSYDVVCARFVGNPGLDVIVAGTVTILINGGGLNLMIPDVHSMGTDCYMLYVPDFGFCVVNIPRHSLEHKWSFIG